MERKKHPPSKKLPTGCIDIFYTFSKKKSWKKWCERKDFKQEWKNQKFSNYDFSENNNDATGTRSTFYDEQKIQENTYFVFLWNIFR